MRTTNWRKRGPVSASQAVYHLAEIGSPVSLCGRDISRYIEYPNGAKGRQCLFCAENLRITQPSLQETSGGVSVSVSVSEEEAMALFRDLQHLMRIHRTVSTMTPYERFFANVVGGMETEIIRGRERQTKSIVETQC